MAPAKKHLRVTETIIQEVQNHPSLWDKRHKNYKDFVVNSNAWEEILANVKSEFSNEDTLEQIETIDELKNIWKNVRDTYTRRKKKAKGQSGAGLQDVKQELDWPFFKMLQFLDQSESYGESSQVESSAIQNLTELSNDSHQDSEELQENFEDHASPAPSSAENLANEETLSAAGLFTIKSIYGICQTIITLLNVKLG